MPHYDGVEKRKAVPSPSTPGHRETDEMSIMNVVLDVRTKIMDLESSLGTRIAEEVKKMEKVAFPNGDPVGHCAYHEVVTHRIEVDTEFREKMLYELKRWGLIGFAGWIVYTFIPLAWKALLIALGMK